MNNLAKISNHVVGVVFSPRKTFQRLMAGEGSLIAPLAIYFAVQLAIVARPLYKSVHLFSQAPESVARRFFLDTVWRRGSLHADVAIVLVVAATLAVIARWISPAKRSPRASVESAAYLLVPVSLLMALGFILHLFGWNLWFLPHTAIDSQSILVFDEGRVVVSWMRFATKCVVSYGWSFALILMILRDLWMPSEADSPDAPLADVDNTSSTSFSASGTTSAIPGVLKSVAVWGMWATVVLASVADVAIEANRLRPLLPGDAIGETDLRWISPQTASMKKRFNPADYRGKILVIDFWASWCAPCRRAIPELSAIAEEYRGKVEIVGVNREPGQRKKAKAAWVDLKFGFPSAIDVRRSAKNGAGRRGGFGERVGLQSLPTTIVVGADGTTKHIHLGYTPASTLRAELDALLASP